jgi:sterol desaturase/sphingolipid hydroxylase (fatty acid hydroxylase superfamily)
MVKETLTIEHIEAMKLPSIIAYAGPLLIFFAFLEYFITRKVKKKEYIEKDALAALAVGLVNVGISAIIKLALFQIVLFAYNLSLWKIPHSWWSYPLCFIFLDFCRYWAHRIGHRNRFFWATHVTHHSSKQYNLTVSFRLSWMQFVKVIFFLPVALAGFHPIPFFFCHQVLVLYQFWIHTEYIKKLHPVIEYIFVTPSHHRVHHGSDADYIDKNFGSTFIVWDRMFGTFEPEVKRPTYGITKEIKSYNPVYLVFHEFVDIGRDLRKARTFREVRDIIFGPPR